jgi:hypothetical protein
MFKPSLLLPLHMHSSAAAAYGYRFSLLGGQVSRVARDAAFAQVLCHLAPALLIKPAGQGT